ncbi:MAG: archaellar assembly protein FlaJ [Methanospirillum sp.]|uniref:archaellar assembly protein FlaJ n=1 Tax=Methanospirillum sp. TaxID=45200 RepID=UPI0023739F1D|nr:archaellar assembly protein FlaJ [Methanospirillum sp.]MDD1728929.1 archaellar assembly protein FlaJ [Methanospirillum sp.]
MFESIFDRIRKANNGTIPFEGTVRTFRAKLYKFFVEDKMMGSDLLFMLTYMAAILTANASRPEIFSYTGARREYVSTKYIYRADILVKRWGYSYVEALVNVAKKIENEMLFSMVNRYANAIESGVPDEDFLTRELDTTRNVYRSSYEQGLEMLKKWGDAYISLLFTGALVGIIIMMSIAIYAPADVQGTLNMSYMIIVSISVLGITTMFKAVPSDPKTHGLPQGSPEQNMIHRMERKVVPILAVIVLLLLLLGMNYGLILMLIGMLLFPLGIIGFIDDGNITLRDAEFPTFIRSVGAIQGGKGTTIGPALAEIEKKSLKTLEPLINGVYTKLNLGLDDKRSWQRFINDSGSYLIYKYLNIYRDSIEIGGKAEKIGEVVSSSMLDQVLLREHRHTLSMGFITLLVPMHAMMVSLFIALYQVLVTMSEAITSKMASLGEASAALSSGQGASIASSVSGSLFVFANFDAKQMGTYVVITTTLLLIANTFAGKVVSGGDRSLLYFFASLLCAVTGIIYIAAPIIITMLFKIPTFEGV